MTRDTNDIQTAVRHVVEGHTRQRRQRGKHGWLMIGQAEAETEPAVKIGRKLGRSRNRLKAESYESHWCVLGLGRHLPSGEREKPLSDSPKIFGGVCGSTLPGSIGAGGPYSYCPYAGQSQPIVIIGR
jgi:hypothetical protein